MPNCGSRTSNGTLLRNSIHSCHWAVAGRARMNASTAAVPYRMNRRRCPNSSWKRSTNGCTLAGNTVGAARSAM